MSRWNAYLNTAEKIIEAYNGKIPLAAWLKDFFRQHKQMGSSDRKIMSELVYSYYRLGHAAKQISVSERLLTAFFLCSQSPAKLLDQVRPEWNTNIELPLLEKIKQVESLVREFDHRGIFPWKMQLSDGMNEVLFNLSFLQQPDLFLRIRPDKNNIVVDKLIRAGIGFQVKGDACLALPNTSKANEVLELDREAVVQDSSSQKTGDLMRESIPASKGLRVWDCCAGSGGKSIMAYDLLPGIELTVSDIRPSILQNLRKRFQLAGIDGYQTLLTDLSNENALVPETSFDVIIADVPCSGSGTWARTPEQLYYFEESGIQHYSELQKKILMNAAPALKKGGWLIYITCSVFKEENEQVVQFLQQHGNFRVLTQKLIQGYEMKADTMFVAVVEKVVG